jgi:hypothetical protein
MVFGVAQGAADHAINIARDFVLLGNRPGAQVKVLEYSGFTNGSQLLLTMMIFAADMTRVVLRKGVIGARAAGMTVWGFLGGGHAHDGLGTRLLFAGAERLVRDWPEAARLIAV